MKVVHTLETKIVNPTNAREITFNNHFSNIALINNVDDYRLSVESDTIVLVGEDARYFKQKVDEIGTSLFMNYYINLPSTNLQLEYYVDLNAEHVFHEDVNGVIQKVEFKIISSKDFRLFYDRARSTTFSLVAKNQGNFNYVDVHYRIIPPDRDEKAVVLIFQTTSIAIQIERNIVQLIKDTAQLIAAFTPAVGAGVVVVVGQIVFAILQVIVDAVQLLLELVLFTQSFNQTKEVLFPALRKFKGCNALELISKSCQYLGYSFQSNYLTTYFPDMVILGTPMRNFSDKGLLSWKGYTEQFQNQFNLAYTYGHPTAMDGEISFLWGLIDYVCNKRHLKCVVNNGKVFIEPESYFDNLATVSLTSTPQDQESKLKAYRLNTEEKWKRTVITYQTDPNDFYTLDDTDNLTTEYSQEIVNQGVRKPNLTGLQDRVYPVALGKRQEKLNVLLAEFKKLLKKVDKLCGSSLASKIKDPKGELVISEQYFKVPKVLLLNPNGFIQEDYKKRMSPSLDWDNGINLSSILNNGYKIYENVTIPVTEDEYKGLLTNNVAMIDGKKSRVITLKYYPYSSKVVMTYKQKENYEAGKIKVEKIY